VGRATGNLTDPRCLESVVNLPVALVGYPHGDLCAGAETEFAEDVLDMTFGGALRDHQVGGNLLVRMSLGDQLGDFSFAPGELLP
jgi:hypothetical protein